MKCELPDASAYLTGSEGLLAKRPGLGKLSRNMQAAVRQVLTAGFLRNGWTIAHAGLSVAQLGKEAATRLQVLGITGAWATMAAWPLLPTDLLRRVWITLLKQRGERQTDVEEAFLEGRLYLRPKSIAKSMLPVWRPFPRPLEPHTFTTSGQQVHKKAAPAVSWQYQVQCQLCHSTVVLPDKPVRSTDGWPRVQCGSCRKQIRVGQAKCQLCRYLVRRCSCRADLPRPAVQTVLPWTAAPEMSAQVFPRSSHATVSIGRSLGGFVQHRVVDPTQAAVVGCAAFLPAA